MRTYIFCVVFNVVGSKRENMLGAQVNYEEESLLWWFCFVLDFCFVLYHFRFTEVPDLTMVWLYDV